ncbi:MAG: hypothetical protein V5A43_08820 [Haloarculaceae archaeon]
MYLSHPVRRIRDDPEHGATVELVVTAADADREPAQGASGGTEDDTDGDVCDSNADDGDSDADEGDLDALASALEGAGADVVERLRFRSVRIECPERAVPEMCSLDGIESIETGTTRELAWGDAGEDL